MIIKTRNVNPDIISIKELKEAAVYFTDKLLTKRQSDNVELLIKFDDIPYKGYIEWLDKPIKPREFKIVLNSNYKKKQSLITLAHEIVHLKQYVTGELTDATIRNNARWKRKEINEEKIDYFDLPFEIEAYGREFGLYKRFVERNLPTPEDRSRAVLEEVPGVYV